MYVYNHMFWFVAKVKGNTPKMKTKLKQSIFLHVDLVLCQNQVRTICCKGIADV